MENKMNIARSVIAMYMVAWLTLACAAAQETAGPTWPDYLQDCGLKAIDANEARSVAAFEAKYKGKTIHWSGRVDTTKDGWWGKYDMYVLMNPTESTFTKSDLQITIPKEFKDLVLSLNKGDDIVFDGTIDTQGGHFSHHMITVTTLARPGVQAPAERPPAEEPQKTVPTTNQDSLEAARKSLIGTWTYTKPGIVLWSKWVIKDDGTLDFYTAKSNYRDWGTATSFKWVSITDKDPVTGDLVYGVQPVRDVTDHMPKVLACKDGLGRLVVKVGGVDPDHLEFITMERGDKFPFEKHLDANVDIIMQGALDEFTTVIREMVGIPKATGNEPSLTPTQLARFEAIIAESQSHDDPEKSFEASEESKELKIRKLAILHKYMHDSLKDAILVKPVSERDAAIERLREASKEPEDKKSTVESPVSPVLPPTKATDDAEAAGKAAIAEYKARNTVDPPKAKEAIAIHVDATEGYYTYQRAHAAQLVAKFNQINATLAENPPVEQTIPPYKKTKQIWVELKATYTNLLPSTTDPDALTILHANIAQADKVIQKANIYLETHSLTDEVHEARKARAAYLIQYITERGNEIDLLNANGQNPRNYWRAIIDAQNEILNIYKVELQNACQVNDEHAISVLKANIDKLSNGRDFAWNALKNYPK
jgi:hypothetical protein